MDEFVLAHLFARVPGKALKPFPHETGGHTHNEDHVTAIWGRHRLIVEAPILGADGAQKRDADGELLFHVIRNVELAGNGPDSLITVPFDHRHNLIALEPGCFHACLFLHKDGEGKTVRGWRGEISATT